MNFHCLRKHRLRKRVLFRKVYEEGRSVSNRQLSFHFLPNPDQRRRVGFAAGQKLGGAVLRNRCKRRLRECYRLNQERLPAGMDCIFVARKAMVDVDWQQLSAAFLDLLRRSRTLTGSSRR